jgi:hypothetical protein
MRITNPKITRQNVVPMLISCLLLLGIWVSLLLHFPAAAWSNPPNHHYGGFDFGHWWTGWAIYGGQMIAALLLWRSRYGYRPILAVVIVVLALCIMLNLSAFLVALRKPTL